MTLNDIASVGLAAVLLLLAAMPSALAEDAPPPALELLLPAPHYLEGWGETLRTRIPFRWRADLEEQKIALVVAYARFGELDPRRLAQASQAAVEPQAGLQWLVLSIDFADLVVNRRFGTYEIALEGYAAAAESQQDGTPPKPLFSQSLELNRSPSSLAGLSAFTVEQRRFLWWLLDPVPASPLRLRPAAGPPPADLKIFQDGSAKIGNLNVPGELDLADPAALTTLDGEAPQLSIVEPFRLGDAAGQLKIVSPDMEEVSVGFTMRSRQHPSLVPIIAFFGLLAGLGTRVWLAAYIEKRRVLLQIGELRRRLTAARGRFSHRPFQGEIERIDGEMTTLAGKLRSAATKEDAARHAQALTGLQSDLDAALQGAETHRTTLRSRLGEILEVTRASWSLSAKVAAAVAAANENLDQVGQLLDRGDLDAAEPRLAQVGAGLAESLGRLFPAWERHLRSELDQLQKTSPPLSETVVAPLAAAAEEVGTILGRELPEPHLPATEAIRSLLDTVHQSFQKTSELLSEVALATASVVDEVRTELEKAGSRLKDPGAVTALEPLAKHLRSGSLPLPDEGFHAVLKPALTGMKEAVEEQLAKPATVAADLQAGNYVAAAKAAVKPPGPVALGRPAVTGGPGADAAVRWQLRSTTPGSAPTLFVQRVAELPGHVPIEPARLGREIWRARILQTVLVGAGLLLVATALFADSFVGTVGDWNKIFFWGFTTDVGVNVLLERVRGQGSED